MAGLAVIKQKGFISACSSIDKPIDRTGLASFKWAATFVKTASKAAASLSLPDLAALVYLVIALSTEPKSDKANSVSITPISEIGSTRPAT